MKNLLILIHPDCIAEVSESATNEYDALLKNHLGRFDYIITHLFHSKDYADSLQKRNPKRHDQIQKIRLTVGSASNEAIESESEKCSYSKNIPDYLIMNPGVTVYMAGGYEDNCLWASYIRLFKSLHDVLHEGGHRVYWYRPLIFQDMGHGLRGTKPYPKVDPDEIRMDRENPQHVSDRGALRFHPDKVDYGEPSFKEWLLKEDPDSVDTGSKILYWWDAISFFILDNLCIYQDGQFSHYDVEQKIRKDCAKVISSIHDPTVVSDRKMIIKCINSTGAKTLGDPTYRDIDLLIRAFVPERIPHSRPREDETIRGRIWDDEKVISFWNSFKDVKAKEHKVFEFISSIGGSPSEYRYEVEGILLNYQQFLNGYQTKSPSFDTSKIHTMIPGIEKTNAMKSLQYKPKTRDIKNPHEGD